MACAGHSRNYVEQFALRQRNKVETLNSCVSYSHFITADYANPRRKKSALGVRAPDMDHGTPNIGTVNEYLFATVVSSFLR